jgi:hypothetical protein
VDSLHDHAPASALGELSRFRQVFYASLTARADAQFELTDAVLCADGPVTSLVELTLVAEHRRGHGAMYDALNQGQLEPQRLRRSLAALPLPRATDGRIVLGVDVSPWLRPDAATSPDRLFCHVYGRGKGNAQLIPGWPYSFVAALEPGRSSWTALLDAVRLGPADDATAVTAAQLRAVIEQLIAAGHWQPGDPDIVVVADTGADTGYDITRLAYLLDDLPVELVGRIRSDRVLRLPRPPRPPGTNGRPPRHGPEIAPPRPGDRPEPARHLARTGAHHHDRDHPLRHRGRDQLGPGPPPADPPHLLDRPHRTATHHRSHPDPAPGPAPARRPGPQTRVAVDLAHRRHPGRCGSLVAGVPAPLRPRAHLPAAQTDPRLDPAEDPHPRSRGPLDLARDCRPHPASPGPAAGR